METKVCNKCDKEKNVDEFGKLKSTKDGYSHYCKECNNKSTQKWRDDNREHVKKINTEKKRILREKTPEKYKVYNKKYYNENRKHLINCTIDWQKNNKERLKEYRSKKHKNRYENDILYRIKCTTRNRIKRFLKSKDLRINENASYKFIGCSLEFLKEYIEKKFTVGMTWENYGQFGWHIDHIIPLDDAKNEDDVYKLCHYTNLQPLWWKENLEKGKKKS